MSRLKETEAVLFLERHRCPVARMQGDTMRFLDHEQSGKRISIHEQLEENVRELILREEFIGKFGYAVLARYGVDVLLRYGPLLEVGAGSGYWAYEIEKGGGDIIATDPGTGRYRIPHGHWAHPWTTIYKLRGPEAVKDYPRRSLLIVWPDIDADWPHETLASYSGETVIYVGEGPGGCAANEAFHGLLEKAFDHENTINIPQFFGLHDRMEIWRR